LYESEDIGENGLIENVYHRAGHIIADKDCHFACLHKKDFLPLVN
jgi:hypothetical protein